MCFWKVWNSNYYRSYNGSLLMNDIKTNWTGIILTGWNILKKYFDFIIFKNYYLNSRYYSSQNRLIIAKFCFISLVLWDWIKNIVVLLRYTGLSYVILANLLKSFTHCGFCICSGINIAESTWFHVEAFKGYKFNLP